MIRSGAALLLLACLAAPPALAQDAPLVAGENGVPVPKRTRHVAPEYPREAQAEGIRGIVILALTIDEKGRVSAVDVVRSIPGLDEAAITAARRWEYEPLRVDGKPVAVRLTVPITFLLKLPETTHDDGVPELRQGAAPAWPPGASSRVPVRVGAELIVDANGRVVSAVITAGEQPWSDALMAALRTWAFVAESSAGPFAVDVRAQFSPAERSGQPRVALHLGGLRRNVALPSDARAEARRGAQPAAAPQAPPVSPPSPTASPAPTPAPGASPAASPETAPPATTTPSPGPPAATPQAAANASPAPGPGTEPAAQPSGPAAPSPAPPPQPRPAQPAAEVLRGPAPVPTPPPTPGGVSAVRDVQLALGVPDLAKGRRPVVPPLARMAGLTGTVSVRFAIDGAGATSVGDVEGPEPLQAAARSVVESWSFRRTSIDRLRAVAEIVYRADTATANVRLDPQ